MRKVLLAVLALAPLPALAVPITFTLSDAVVNVTYGGVTQNVDLTIVASADTDDYIASLASGAGSGYANVLLTYTSAALGLSGVTGSELWDFTFHFGGTQDSVILDDAGVFKGAGAYNFGGAVTAWDGISAVGPIVSGGAVSNSPGLPTDTIGGVALVLNSFGDLTTFTASIGSTPAPVPEPATLSLLGAGLLALGLTRRRRGART